jgi:hypothetical protein
MIFKNKSQLELRNYPPGRSYKKKTCEHAKSIFTACPGPQLAHFPMHNSIDFDGSTLGVIPHVLDKPVLYFFPEEFQDKISIEDLTVLEQELLTQAQRLNMDDLHK